MFEFNLKGNRRGAIRAMAVTRGDPAKGGKMDILGARAGYSQFFGTKRTSPRAPRVQMVLPAGDRGALIEIDVIAVRSK